MLDCSRNAVPNVPYLKRFIDIVSSLGYNELQLYTEDTYEIPSEKYFGYLRGRFSKEEIREIDEYCKQRGVELVPCIQTFAHLDNIFGWKRFSPLRDSGNALLADEEKTYEFIEKEFQAVAEAFSSSKINIGMDEAHGSGLGEHLKRYGYEDPQKIFFRHLKRVTKIAEKYGFRPMLWSDMFFKYENGGEYYSVDPVVSGSTLKKMPGKAELIYWDYNVRDRSAYRAMIGAHRKIAKNNFRWAGAAWSWIGLVPHNNYALAAMQAAIPVMRENGVKNYMLAMWGDDGAVCPRLSNLPSIYCFAEMVKGNFDLCSVAEGFYKRFGVKWEDFLKIDTPNLLDSLPLDVYNPAKYMLYNDCFLGIFDSTVNENGAKKYKKYAAELEKLSGDENFGMLFDTEAKLCKVLAQKYSLGIETRRYYALGDRETMRKIVKKYAKTERLLADFYEKLKKQWFYENKPFGFEVQAARIGGLKQRISDCKNRLIGWADGKIGRIEELEEEILDYDGNEAFTKTAVVNNSYREIISAGYD